MPKSSKLFTTIGVSVTVLGCIAFAAQTVAAADLRTGTSDQYQNGMLIVPPSDQVRNLYAAAPQVLISASSQKDTSAVGAVVEVDGSTADDLTVAGGTVSVRGNVGGSARIIGGTVTVDGKIVDDLAVAGGNVTVSPSASVGGDLIIAGGTVIVSGPVARNIRVAAGTLILNGTVGGDVSAKVGSTIQLGPGASVGGDISYTSPNDMFSSPSSHVGGHVLRNVSDERSGVNVFWIFLLALVTKVLAEILVAYILFYMFRERAEQSVRSIQAKFWKNLGYGFLFAIAVPVACVIALITVVGYYLAIVAALAYAAGMMLAWLAACAYVGVWLASKVKRHTVELGYGTIAIGVAVVTLLSAVPIVGWLCALILLLVGFGGTVSLMNR